ncbi:MAG: septum formation initiator family protein [Lachnospiraceae bacterium]
MAQRRKVRVKYYNRISMYALGVLLLCIALFFMQSTKSLETKKLMYELEVETLEADYESEVLRVSELDEFEKYTQTKQYVEKIAKEQLGLVYEDEILFKQSN